ncbi:hypothetical protein ACQ86O_05095 [Serratia sp. L9]|uniref:hypothetical protein n=1 Tax=Serratia sp. L9 TaxID=3423946 RepID=UPI003D67CE0D
MNTILLGWKVQAYQEKASASRQTFLLERAGGGGYGKPIVLIKLDSLVLANKSRGGFIFL